MENKIREKEEAILELSICMGSSCFARGNNLHVEQLQEFIEKHGLSERVFLKGHLCTGDCEHGPNVRIQEHLCMCKIDDVLKRLQQLID